MSNGIKLNISEVLILQYSDCSCYEARCLLGVHRATIGPIATWSPNPSWLKESEGSRVFFSCIYHLQTLETRTQLDRTKKCTCKTNALLVRSYITDSRTKCLSPLGICGSAWRPLLSVVSYRGFLRHFVSSWLLGSPAVVTVQFFASCR